MSAADNNQSRFDAAFAQIAAIMRVEDHNDATLFRALAQVIEVNAPFAAVLATNIANVLDLGTEHDTEFTEVMIKAYEFSLFRNAHGFPFYDAFEGNPEKAEALATSMAAFSATGSTLTHVACAVLQ